MVARRSCWDHLVLHPRTPDGYWKWDMYIHDKCVCEFWINATVNKKFYWVNKISTIWKVLLCFQYVQCKEAQLYLVRNNKQQQLKQRTTIESNLQPWISIVWAKLSSNNSLIEAGKGKFGLSAVSVSYKGRPGMVMNRIRSTRSNKMQLEMSNLKNQEEQLRIVNCSQQRRN